MRYYKVYNFNSYPYSSVKAAMKDAKVYEAEIVVNWHQSHNGRLSISKHIIFKIREPKLKLKKPVR